jgi:hypothetical protein
MPSAGMQASKSGHLVLSSETGSDTHRISAI